MITKEQKDLFRKVAGKLLDERRFEKGRTRRNVAMPWATKLYRVQN